MIFNPYAMSSMPWGLLGGLRLLLACVRDPEEWYFSTQLGILISMTRGCSVLWLIYGTIRAWRERKEEKGPR